MTKSRDQPPFSLFSLPLLTFLHPFAPRPGREPLMPQRALPLLLIFLTTWTTLGDATDSQRLLGTSIESVRSGFHPKPWSRPSADLATSRSENHVSAFVGSLMGMLRQQSSTEICRHYPHFSQPTKYFARFRKLGLGFSLRSTAEASDGTNSKTNAEGIKANPDPKSLKKDPSEHSSMQVR